jgi:hypothetical protein
MPEYNENDKYLYQDTFATTTRGHVCVEMQAVTGPLPVPQTIHVWIWSSVKWYRQGKTERLGDKKWPSRPTTLSSTNTNPTALPVQWLRRLVAGLPPRRPGFAPSSVHVGFVVDKVAVGHVFHRGLRFPLYVLSFHQDSLLIYLGEERWVRWWSQFRQSHPIDPTDLGVIRASAVTSRRITACVMARP